MINFYTVSKEYIKYLKNFENKIPNVEYKDRKDKFFCGVVLTINNLNYFAPISSYNQRKRTNIIMKILDFCNFKLFIKKVLQNEKM
jgi:protein AbiQ